MRAMVITMNILVVGGGGREHAIIKKLRQSSKVSKIYCAPGNGGISKDATCVNIKATDINGIANFCKVNTIDLCVVAPDDPLVMGMVDALEAAGIKAFGPNKAAAALEGSKVFSKQLMKQYNIPTAAYESFTDMNAAITYVREQNTYPVVVKADGLALGKGVIIAEDFAAAEAGIHSIMEDKVFGASGNAIVIEEFLIGPEVSVLSFCDGNTIVPMVSAMDHKRALDGDRGLNTGGMGTIAPNPFFTADVADECMETIFKPTVTAMNSEGRPFKGVIFFGLMITPNGTKVIEYNCRFGDPETQVVLPLLKTDLVDIFMAVIDGTLDKITVEFESGACACVVMASGGYPQAYKTGFVIEGLDSFGRCPDATVYHAGTKAEHDSTITSGGRVLGVTAKGDNLTEAINNAYNAVHTISFEGAQFRRDIGHRALNG